MNIVIAGIHSAIGQALATYWHQQGHRVFGLSRAPHPPTALPHLLNDYCTLDLTDPVCVTSLTSLFEQWQPDLVLCCMGILHDDQHQPEKSLQQLDDAWFLHSMQVNVLSHAHVAQALSTLMSRTHAVRMVSLSAMVGSISDNRLGGWYSYRISKAALNMLIKTISIEWQRKNKNCVIAALHPGTTYSPLSTPFAKPSEASHWQSPADTAARLAPIIMKISPEQSGHLLHWDGSVLPF